LPRKSRRPQRNTDNFRNVSHRAHLVSQCAVRLAAFSLFQGEEYERVRPASTKLHRVAEPGCFRSRPGSTEPVFRQPPLGNSLWRRPSNRGCAGPVGFFGQLDHLAVHADALNFCALPAKSASAEGGLPTNQGWGAPACRFFSMAASAGWPFSSANAAAVMPSLLSA